MENDLDQNGPIYPKSMLPPTVSQDSDLPMITWIRGDEPYAEEFHLSAEKVMDMLGIKRSRLTQISGKELRVGRRRVERYIRPFFRKKDVDAYLRWTRTPASHIKSTNIVKTATDKVAEEQRKLNESIRANLDRFYQDYIQQIKNDREGSFSSNAKIIQLLKSLREGTQSQLGLLIRQLYEQKVEMARHIESLKASGSNQETRLKVMEKLTTDSRQSLEEIKVKTEQVNHSIKQENKYISACLDTLMENAAELLYRETNDATLNKNNINRNVAAYRRLKSEDRRQASRISQKNRSPSLPRGLWHNYF